ncbi:MAG: BolA family protein [Rhizobium sp.]|uniref:BolA family protein n=1 Tax=Rhizobium sp. TaxID=391 RepID=UPI00389ABFFC
MSLGKIGERIAQKLQAAFSPSQLEVVDESHKHAGHAGARPGGETHFQVRIVAGAFQGKSLLDRHRLVNETLAEELAGPVHALSITALSISEADRQEQPRR